MTAKRSKRNISSILLYAFGFLLLWEWLRPLKELTDTANIWIFIIFLLISFSLSFLGIHTFVGAALKIIFILYALNYLYFEGSFFSFSWFSPLISDIAKNIGYIAGREWPSLTSMFRSLLFFIFLWLMTYLLQYWLVNRRKIFVFFFMTLVYVTVLDTFTPYAADAAIVRTVIAGFAIMGMLTFYRLIEKEAIHQNKAYSKKWMIPLAVMIAFSAAAGYAAPKAEPIWPDPVPYIKSYSPKTIDEANGSIQKVGYGTDDSRLGGPFIQDDSVVFRAEADSRNYWRVETKDIYTGKGWEVSEENPEMVPFGQEELVPFSSFAGEVETEEKTASVFFEMSYPHVVYPAGIQKINANISYSFEANPNTEKIYSLEAGSARPLKQYTINYEIPTYSVAELMKTANNAGLSQEFIQRYTQLPPNLPLRVGQLAEQITAGKQTWFDKARTVEQYFQGPEFTYDRINVAVPGEKDDYVDQFLFDTKRGYCDNYSSSMVVMLRSLGIPARWVKGYTDGEFKGFTAENRRIFEITNNNAHSWVEVYFPNTGWVPFEPTKGFSDNVQFNFDTNQETVTMQEEPKQPEDQPAAAEPEQPEQEAKAASSSFSFDELWNEIKTFVVNQWLWILLVAAVFASLAFWVYFTRRKWLPYFFIWKFNRKGRDDQFAKAFLVLLKQLERYGLKRNKDQTLRDYARHVDAHFSTREMSGLTGLYERFLYRGQLQDGGWNESKELWENLIKRTIA